MLKTLLYKLNQNDLFKYFVKKIGEKFNYNYRISINSRKFFIPIVKNIGYGNVFAGDGFWMSDLLNKLLRIKSGSFIDIGANIGQSLLQLKSIDTDRKYIGFEPNPSCASYIRELIRKNKFKNCMFIPVGLFNENRLINLHLRSDADSGASIINDLRPGYNYNENLIVPVLKFETIVKNLNIQDVCIFKIDVEGAELEVLQCIKSFLGIFKAFIICEILWSHNEKKLKDSEIRNTKILQVLKDSNYSIFQLIKTDNDNEIIKLKRIIKLESQVYTLKNRNLCDYLLVHNTNLNALSNFFEITN